MKRVLLLSLLTAFAALIPVAPAWAALTSVTQTWSGNVPIPDGSHNGVSEHVTITSGITAITDIQVTLDITGAGAYDGDFYAYLRSNHGGMAILLNRLGRTSLNASGSAAAGLDVRFTQTAANGDVHNGPLSGSAIAGDWQPDGRLVNPYSVLNTSPRTALLSSFVGLDPNTTWTLFVCDTSPGGLGTLAGFGVTVFGNAVSVPEASTRLCGLLAAGLTWVAARASARRRASLRRAVRRLI